MPNNDREVFDHLTADPSTPGAEDFITYAVFAHEKREWIKLWESRHNGTGPTQSDIDDWIANITESHFNDMRSGARAFFVDAAETFFSARLKTERENILRNAIVSEVRSASSFWKQLGMALLTAIVAPLILGGVIAAGLFYSAYLTPAEIAKRLHAPAAEQPPTVAPSPTAPANP